jgi:hypothetical protein
MSNKFAATGCCTMDIAVLWKAAAAAPSGAARSTLFWELVEALRVSGFAGNPRRFLERVAPWGR